MRFFRFEKHLNLLIANENTNEEFIIINNWNFVPIPGHSMNFDIWALIDFHKFYWLVKFNRKFKKMGLSEMLNK
jgi:hypothetical protein